MVANAYLLVITYYDKVCNNKATDSYNLFWDNVKLLI